MKNIILIAPPAAGKGTQAELLREKYNMPHISTGNLIRERIKVGDDFAKELEKTISGGNLVSDEIVAEMLKERIVKPDCDNGYVLDGYPRNLKQAEDYKKLLRETGRELGYVVNLHISKEKVIERMLGRQTCDNCDTVYNKFADELKPEVPGICDICGHKLISRSDDNREAFATRYDIYMKDTAPLLDYYKAREVLHTVNAAVNPDFTFVQIDDILQNGRMQ